MRPKCSLKMNGKAKHATYVQCNVREGFLTHALTWRDLESIMLSEICQKEKDNYCITPLIEGPLNRQIHRDGK